VTERDLTRPLRRVALGGAALATGLIVLGGVVRITGSGMGCGDHWPLCDGEWFPPLDLPTMIEIGHRWAAALVSLAVFTGTVLAWRRHRHDAALLVPATLASVLLIVQVLLGAVTVKLDLPPWVVITHFANAMLLLLTLLVVGLRAGRDAGSRAPLRRSARHSKHWLVLVTAALGFVVILFGAQVANFDAGLLCLGFPLCNGSALPPEAPLAALHWAHRALAFLFLVALGITVAAVSRNASPESRQLRRWAALVLAATVAQIGVAVAMILSLLPGELRALHLLIGTLVWVALVVLVFHSARTPAETLAEVAPAASARNPSILRDLVTLTKPRIISLLLVTTIAPMFITPAGLPTVSQVLWVMLAGYLMAGGANAINMWFDRDIDTRMSRTRLRPIPSGRIAPEFGLAYGIALGFIAFGLFWYQVNPLSAWLALGGLLFYVFIYTIWLKRSSPQNIVIGGAAGAFPPLVGWAAMTGEIDLAAIYLFAIVFYWTPPHFWALALVKQAEYAKAGIPMLPVVRGEARTKYEMLVYTLILLPLTVLPFFFGALGPFYALAAALLGARLLWYCLRLRRERGVTPVAWRMYRYSLLYLALLFTAMGVDRALPYGGPRTPDRVMTLEKATLMPAAPAATHQHLDH
jgi:protoheme IX farnesyltransferase